MRAIPWVLSVKWVLIWPSGRVSITLRPWKLSNRVVVGHPHFFSRMKFDFNSEIVSLHESFTFMQNQISADMMASPGQ